MTESDANILNDKFSKIHKILETLVKKQERLETELSKLRVEVDIIKD